MYDKGLCIFANKVIGIEFERLKRSYGRLKELEQVHGASGADFLYEMRLVSEEARALSVEVDTLIEYLRAHSLKKGGAINV